MKETRGSLFLVSAMWGLGILGCGMLYGPFKVPSQDNCNNNPPLCSDTEQCDTGTGYCVPLTADLASGPDLVSVAPTVISVSPSSAFNDGPHPITITGTGFQNGATVKVGPLSCMVVNATATQINCTVLANPMNPICGKQDIVVTNPDQTTGTAAKLFNLRSATPFGAPFGTYGASTQGLIAVDLTGDNIPELVSVNATMIGVSVNYANGDGTFTSTSTFNVGTSQRNAIVAGDFNMDGKVDVVTANTTGNISFCAGNGIGGFAMGVQFTTSAMSSSLSLVAADVNKDGKLDVVTVNSDNSVSVMRGDGLGGFSNFGTNLVVPSTPHFLALGDLNGDGNLDLAVSHDFAGPSVHMGAGDGTFAAGSSINVGGNSGALSLYDINGDTKVDLLVSLYNNAQVVVLPGNGQGGFDSPIAIPVGNTPEYIQHADFDGDGLMDFVTINGGGAGNLSVVYGDPNGMFTPALSIPFSAASLQTVVGDFNADGIPDIAAETQFYPNNVRVLLGQRCM